MGRFRRFCTQMADRTAAYGFLWKRFEFARRARTSGALQDSLREP